MIYLESEFPLEYLNKSKSKEERMFYFRSLIRTHDFFKEAEAIILSSIHSPRRNRLLLVLGPTGVGKTALTFRIIERIMKTYRPQMNADHGMIPIAKIDVPAPGGRYFDWKEIHIKVLQSLQDVLIDSKVDYARLSGGMRPLQARSTLTALKDAHINALKNRKVVAFIFDEAHHLTLTASSKQLLYNLEYIKSLADSSNVPHVLFGTYDLLKLRNLNGQLIRRCKDIHFPRYHSNIRREREAFERFLLTILRQVPLERVPDPIANETTDFFFERCVGSAGILKDWISDALDMSLENREKELDMSVLEKTAIPTDQCLRIATEANMGERSFLDDEKDRENLRRAVGYGEPEKEGDKEEEMDEIADIEHQLQPKKDKRKGSRRPGTRKPARDAVGL